MFELFNMWCDLSVCALPNNTTVGVNEDDVVGEWKVSRYMLLVSVN